MPTETFTIPGAYTWTCPGGVSTVTVICIGGGGAGGGGDGGGAGGGGGGGMYSKITGLSVISGQVYDVTVGAGGIGNITGDGGSGSVSRFSYSASYYCSAAPGAGGASGNIRAGGNGGSNAGIGSTLNSGGNGGEGELGAGGAGGGGGSSGGSIVVGNNGFNGSVGAGGAGGSAPTDGGAGGQGGGSATGGNLGGNYGGGGGGAGESSSSAAGDGAGGYVEITYTYDAPTISYVDPNTGNVTGGTSVTIYGSNFREGAVVTFGTGNYAASVVVVNAGTITCDTPASAAGSVDVTVVNEDLQYDVSESAFAYVNDPPVITSIEPNNGPTSGGTSFTITGTGFLMGATVTIAGSPPAGYSVDSSTTITGTTAAVMPATVDVVVTNPDFQADTLTNGFTFNAAPTVLNVIPKTFKASGGSTIEVRGTDFIDGAIVLIDGDSHSVTFNSSTSLSVTVGVLTVGTYTLTVQNPDTQYDEYDYSSVYSVSDYEHVSIPSDATSDGTGDAAWLDTIDAIGEDGSNASCTLTNPQMSDYLDFDFDFNIPTDATITGIYVTVKKYDPHGLTLDDTVKLRVNGSRVGDNKASLDIWATSATIVEYGTGVTDTWGTSVTSTDVNGPGFGVSIRTGLSGGTSTTVYIDNVTMTVIFTPLESGSGPIFRRSTGRSTLRSGTRNVQE